MAKVLQNFLIGVGLETENYDKGAKNVENSLSRMRTLVGFTGAAITGAFAFAGTAAIGAGNRVHDFLLKTEGLKTSPEYVYAYGRALAALGGDAEDAISAIKSIEEAQRNLTLKGALGPLEDVALARGDINALMQAGDGKEFLRLLAGMIPDMNKDQQGLVQNALGFSDAVMRSLREGVSKFDEGIARASDLYGDFGKATEAAKEYRRALEEINTRFEGIGETLAEKMLPSFAGVLDSVGGFIDRNKDTLGLISNKAAENPVGSTLVAGGATAAIIGAGMKMGVRGVGSALSMAGPVGMAAGAGLIYLSLDEDDREKLASSIYNATKDAWGDAWGFVKDKLGIGQQDSGPENAPIEYSPVPQSPLIMSGDEVYKINPYYLDDGTRYRQEGYSPVPPSPIMLPNQQPYPPATPVYEGLQIDNNEAAAINNPGAALIKEWIKNNDSPQTAQKVNVNNSLEVKMELDGRAFDSRVIEVIERRERDAMYDITSTVTQ